MDTKDNLKTMIDAIINKQDEIAQQQFHTFISDKVRNLVLNNDKAADLDVPSKQTNQE